MQTLSRRRLAGGLAAGFAAAAIARPAAAQAKWKWDLPAGYPAGNFHSVNLIQFAKDVKDATAGRLEITVHPGASLFKVPEIMRAVQTNQAQMGELLMVVLENEDAMFGAAPVATSTLEKLPPVSSSSRKSTAPANGSTSARKTMG
jgi:TRAP-type C4-dicarboxylate transport system substrate-binding protein